MINRINHRSKDSLESGIKTIRTVLKIVYFCFACSVFSASVYFWFTYPIDGKPLSTHTSTVASKTFEQLAADGLFDGMPKVKAVLVKKKQCSKRSGPQECISNDDRKSLDNIIINSERHN